MAHPEHAAGFALLEEAVTVLFCRIDDTYVHLNPRGEHYASLKQLSDSEVLTLALFQQLRGVESERSFLREVARFFYHLFPGVVGLHPSSFHRRIASSGASWSTCGGCGADHKTVVREGLDVEQSGDEAVHPWRYAEDRGDAGLPY
jgi:hypothetical protein